MTEPIACFMVDAVSEALGQPGAMFWRNHIPSGDMPLPHLAVMTPAGLWCIDCPASDPPHGYWQRTGTPPFVTAIPSIQVGRQRAETDPSPEFGQVRIGYYHGWLRDGSLIEC